MSDIVRTSGGGEEAYLKNQGYTFGRILGEGSYAKVRSAAWTGTLSGEKSHFACKIICKRKAPKDFVTKFMPREMEVIKKLDHDNVVRLKSVFEFESKVYIFMELAENGDLLTYIKHQGAQKNEQAKQLFKDICGGIAYCHSIDIVHRDLKCENLLMTKDNRVKIADFGFARFCTDPVTKRRVLSRTYCGSAAYAAPEILRGQPYNPKMYDVWSMGCVLFIVVCASMPFDDSNVKRMLKAQTEKRIHFPSRVRGQISELCRNLLWRMLEVDVTKRATVDQCLRCEWLTTTGEETMIGSGSSSATQQANSNAAPRH